MPMESKRGLVSLSEPRKLNNPVGDIGNWNDDGFVFHDCCLVMNDDDIMDVFAASLMTQGYIIYIY